MTNTGNVTLTAVTVDDPLVGTVSLPGDDAGAGGVDDLHGDVHADPGRCGRRGGGQHRDRDGDRRRSAAAVEATDTDVDPDHRRLRRSRLDKQAGAPSGNTAGDTIDYTFVVTNTGNVTLDRRSR